MTVVRKPLDGVRNGKLPPPLLAIEADLARIDTELLETIPEGLGLISNASRLLLRSGGKRLRPALVVMASRAFEGVRKRSLEVACAIEMTHGASLLHDDVVDDTRMRRGQATVGAYWNNKVAVMMGDYLFVRSLLEMCRDDNMLLLTLLSEATGRMVLGQIREIEEQDNFDISLEDYLFIIQEKTAALLAVSSRCGAIIGRAPARSVEKMTEYGLYLGMAFQIVDDVLDFWGDEEQLGKPVGSDLSERKFTLPFIHTMQTVSPDMRLKLRELVESQPRKMGRRVLRKILAIMEQAGARETSMQMAAAYCERARLALREARPQAGADDLEALLDYVLFRQH